MRQDSGNKEHHGVWFGIGLLGIVGWSIVTPTLLGALSGRWLDAHYPARHSWTLTLLIAGLVVGCLTAWQWVEREQREIHKHKEKKDG